MYDHMESSDNAVCHVHFFVWKSQADDNQQHNILILFICNSQIKKRSEMKIQERKFVNKYHHPFVMIKANRTLNTSRANNMKFDTNSQTLVSLYIRSFALLPLLFNL